MKPLSKAIGDFVIERGIPIPDIYEKRGRRVGVSKGYVATIRLLSVGESVLLPITILSASQICGQEMRRLKFSVRYVRRQMDGGVRVWRTK